MEEFQGYYDPQEEQYQEYDKSDEDASFICSGCGRQYYEIPTTVYYKSLFDFEFCEECFRQFVKQNGFDDMLD